MTVDVIQGVSDWMLSTISLYGPLVVYSSAFLLGENGILAAFLLSAQGYIAPQTVFLFAALGSLSADVFWYVVAVRGIKSFYEKKMQQTQAPNEEQMFLVRLADRHTLLFLIGIKFLVGMRIFLTLYIVLKKQLSFGKYIFFNAIGTVLFVGVLYPLGWMLGKGMSSALLVGRGFFGFVSMTVVVVVFVNFFPRLVARIVAMRSKRSANTE